MKSKILIKNVYERTRPKKSEVSRLCSSNKKAVKLLNWKPKFVGKSGLKKGLIKKIKWYVENNYTQRAKKNKYVI